MDNPPVVQKLSMARYESKDIPSYLSAPEVSGMLEACKDNRRNHLLINVLWQTGARISEVLSLTRNDIDPHGSCIRIVTEKQKGKKNKTHRIIPIGPDLLSEILTYILDYHITDRLFDFSRQRAWQIIKKTAIKAGITKPVHPHTLRHSFAIHLLSQGMPLPIIQRLLGHRSILTSMVYLKVTQQDAREFLSRVRF